MPMSRPQRVHLAWTLMIVGVAVFGWMIWSQRLYALTSSPAGGVERREFGLARWLTITTEFKGMFTGGVPVQVVARDFDYHGRGIAINLAATLGIGAVLALSGRRMVRTDRLVGKCDECGYDLTGLRSDRCPECGMPVQARPADSGAAARG